MAILSVASVAAASPHPNAAKLFVDFMLSEEGQTLINNEIMATYSMRKGMKPPEGQLPIEQAKPLVPKDLADYEKASANFPAHFDSIFK